MSGLTIDNPVTLGTAIISGKVIPGDTLLLRAGTYTNDYTFPFTGSAGLPITIKPHPNERVIVNGNFVANGNTITFQNLEFVYLGWDTRETLEAGSDPSDIPNKAVSINTPTCKFINCVFHDLTSLGLWTPAENAEFYGCIMFNNGWSGPDRGHGHGLYVQNDTPTKLIKDCIIFDNFGWGVHAYTTNGKLDNMIFEGCVCFGAGSLYGAAYNNILVGGLQIANNIIVKNCMTYGADGVNIGYSAGADNVTLENNYFPDGIGKVNLTNLTESGNYYGPDVGNQVFLRANEYDVNRANLTIYNEAELDTVSVDVTSVFSVGDTINARNVQDYFVDIQPLTVVGDGTISVNMQAVNRTVAAPVGWEAPATTFPQFGCFVLEKVE